MKVFNQVIVRFEGSFAALVWSVIVGSPEAAWTYHQLSQTQTLVYLSSYESWGLDSSSLLLLYALSLWSNWSKHDFQCSLLWFILFSRNQIQSLDVASCKVLELWLQSMNVLKLSSNAGWWVIKVWPLITPAAQQCTLMRCGNQLQQILIFGEVFLHCNLGLEDVDLEALQPSGLVRPGWNDSGIDSFYLGLNLLWWRKWKEDEIVFCEKWVASSKRCCRPVSIFWHPPPLSPLAMTLQSED